MYTVSGVVSGEWYLEFNVAGCTYMYMITYFIEYFLSPVLQATPWRPSARSLISSLQHTHKVCYKERHNEVDYGSTMLAIATEDLQAAT